ncbi:DUF1707 domain-containing protein [Glycomyces sp. NPDC046736]|uniref:DUF1707 SHOCT-like domain-containing protein n=1 Tax=Glycomyces sp. NPDC046736 TaxID=3155615 RepID=UPI0033D68C0F
MTDQPYTSLRVSDAERTLAVSRLDEAFEVGRLDADEHRERVALAGAAKTYGDFDALFADLPGAGAPRPARSRTGEMRISTADRDAALERLRRAMTEGRIGTAYFQDRTDAVLDAKTDADLRPILDDLPPEPVAPRSRGTAAERLRQNHVPVVSIDPSRRTGDGVSVAAIWCAIAGFVWPGAALPAVILGAIGLYRADNGTAKSSQLPKIAIGLGVAAILFGAIRVAAGW